MEIQKTSDSQSNLEKEEWNWRNQPAQLQTILQSHSHQGVRLLKTNICNVFLYSCLINIVIYWMITGRKNESGKSKLMLAKVSPKAPVKL